MKDDAKKGTNNKNVIDMINLMLYYTHTLYNYIYIVIERTAQIIYLFRKWKAFDGIFERFTYSSGSTIKSDREESAQALR